MNKNLPNEPPENLNKNSDSSLGGKLGKKLAPGDKAPDFALLEDAGARISLASFAGSKLVLYFFPKTIPPAAPRKRSILVACGANSKRPVRQSLAYRPIRWQVMQGSRPNISSNSRSRPTYGRKYMGVERTTFLIAKDGQIAMVWNKVNVPGHAEAVLSAAKAL
jgi:thioredoxin-dependent peroxiredoxin